MSEDWDDEEDWRRGLLCRPTERRSAMTIGIACPGCGHRCCPYKDEMAALDCAGESDVVVGCDRLRSERMTAPDVWDSSVAPGGFVCGECGVPTEDQPCAKHQGTS